VASVDTGCVVEFAINLSNKKSPGGLRISNLVMNVLSSITIFHTKGFASPPLLALCEIEYRGGTKGLHLRTVRFYELCYIRYSESF
jgi:hypothetical protein